MGCLTVYPLILFFLKKESGFANPRERHHHHFIRLNRNIDKKIRNQEKNKKEENEEKGKTSEWMG